MIQKRPALKLALCLLKPISPIILINNSSIGSKELKAAIKKAAKKNTASQAPPVKDENSWGIMVKVNDWLPLCKKATAVASFSAKAKTEGNMATPAKIEAVLLPKLPIKVLSVTSSLSLE